MSLNYRIVRYRRGEGFGLHEVFYDDDGLPWGMTENPATFVCGTDEGPAGIKDSMLVARVDAIQRPVFDEPEEDKWPGKPPVHEESRCADETPAQGAPSDTELRRAVIALLDDKSVTYAVRAQRVRDALASSPSPESGGE